MIVELIGIRPGVEARSIGSLGLSCPVMVDHGIAGGSIQPGSRIVDPVEGARGDAAHDHVLRDVGGQFAVLDAGGDEGLQPVERVGPPIVEAGGCNECGGVAVHVRSPALC